MQALHAVHLMANLDAKLLKVTEQFHQTSAILVGLVDLETRTAFTRSTQAVMLLASSDVAMSLEFATTIHECIGHCW